VNVFNNTIIKTVQVDLCNGADICFNNTDSFNRVVWAATEKLKIHFKNKDAGKNHNYMYLKCGLKFQWIYNIIMYNNKFFYNVV